jgi:hypothetical protein
MLIPNKKKFIIGLLMGVVFLAILALMSSPIFQGQNAFEAADRLYNSIAKGSSYKIPTLEQQAREFSGTNLDLVIPAAGIRKLDWTKKVFAASGGRLTEAGGKIHFQGDLGTIALAALKDSEAMYHDRDKEISDRYGISGREALYAWWTLLTEFQEVLKREKKVNQASFLDEVVKKGVEVGYNFFGIAPQKASSKAGILSLSLCFYVAYTLWWGFAIFFLFEGFGLAMKAGKKKEL